MTNDDIERIITLIVFVFSMGGCYARIKSRIDANAKEIKIMRGDIDRHALKLQALDDIAVLKNQMQIVFSMLEKQQSLIEKGQDTLLDKMTMIYEKLDNKLDK